VLIYVRPDELRVEDRARARRKNRRVQVAPHSSVTERTRENLREIQAGRHGGDERSGPLWLRPARRYFARALLRTKNSERHQNRRSHLPCKRNSSRSFSRQVCLSQGLFTEPSGFRKRRTRCRCCPP